jgi:hypothetical protein
MIPVFAGVLSAQRVACAINRPTRSERAQLYPITCGLIAFRILERERYKGGFSASKLKRQLGCEGCSRALPALVRLRSAA